MAFLDAINRKTMHKIYKNRSQSSFCFVFILVISTNNYDNRKEIV